MFKKLFTNRKMIVEEDLSLDGMDELNKKSDPMRMGMIFLILGFLSFLIWAFYAPLDEGVPCQGVVSFDTKRKTLQHQTGGIVKAIFVKEGQSVKAGDILLTLDDSNIKARVEEMRQRFFGLRASEDRIQAEQLGQSEIKFHPDLKQYAQEPIALQHMHNQQRLLQLKRSTLAAQLGSIQESIMGQEAQIDGLKKIVITLQSQISITKKQLKGITDLAKDGYAPLSQQQDLEVKLGYLTSQLDDSESNILKTERAIQELKQKSLSIKEGGRKDLEVEQSQVIMELDACAEKLKALNEELDRVNIKSPVDGQVIGLQFQTIGSVVAPGQRVLDVAPQGEPLLIEAKIAPNLIDRIKVNQLADVHFTNFAGTPQIVVDGKLVSISNDLLTEPAPSIPALPSYYLARIAVTEEGMKKLDHHILQSGMPTQVIIKTGERSLIKYLLGPFINRVSTAFTER